MSVVSPGDQPAIRSDGRRVAQPRSKFQNSWRWLAVEHCGMATGSNTSLIRQGGDQKSRTIGGRVGSQYKIR